MHSRLAYQKAQKAYLEAKQGYHDKRYNHHHALAEGIYNGANLDTPGPRLNKNLRKMDKHHARATHHYHRSKEVQRKLKGLSPQVYIRPFK